jgi:hypothetical protein
VFSSLEDVRVYPGVTEKLPEIESAPGRYVGHWEAKAEVEVPFGFARFGTAKSSTVSILIELG